jgi:hypothetical protein
VRAYWRVGVLECWRVGVLEWWSGGVVEWWSGGVVEWWSGGVVGRPLKPVAFFLVEFGQLFQDFGWAYRFQLELATIQSDINQSLAGFAGCLGGVL